MNWYCWDCKHNPNRDKGRINLSKYRDRYCQKDCKYSKNLKKLGRVIGMMKVKNMERWDLKR